MGSINVMEESLIDLTREELQSFEPEEISIPIIVIDDQSTIVDVEDACTKLLSGRKALGFDTETKPCFKKGQHHDVALLQLSSEKVVVLVRLSKIENKEIYKPIIDILSNKRILKVGIAIGDDAKGLYDSYGLITNKILDLRDLASASGIGALSLSKIYAVLFEKRISKSQQLSDWEKSEMTDAQIRYAALDAYAGLRIYLKLRGNVTKEMIHHFEIPKPKKKKRRYRRKVNNLTPKNKVESDVQKSHS